MILKIFNRQITQEFLRIFLSVKRRNIIFVGRDIGKNRKMDKICSISNLKSIQNDIGGLIGVKPKFKVRNSDHLSWVYSPGVGACCLEIQKDETKADQLTNRLNQAMIISDCSGFKSYTKESFVQE